MKNLLKVVFVKPRSFMRVFTIKNEVTKRFVQYIKGFIKNHVC